MLCCAAKKYVDSKLNELAVKAIKKQKVDDGSFLAFLMIQDKLTPEQIYGNMTELLTASIDTVSYNTLAISSNKTTTRNKEQISFYFAIQYIVKQYICLVLSYYLRTFPFSRGKLCQGDVRFKHITNI